MDTTAGCVKQEPITPLARVLSPGKNMPALGKLVLWAVDFSTPLTEPDHKGF